MYAANKKRRLYEKTFIQVLGLTGIESLLSYTAAVAFSPLAYPGYDRLSQAVSDLSAANAPSLGLWNRLSALYNVCEVLCAVIVPAAYFGVVERFIVFAATGFNAALGLHLFFEKPERAKEIKEN